MSHALADAIHTHYKLRRILKIKTVIFFQNRTKFLKTDYTANSSKSTDSFNVEMVSPAQSMRDKKRLKGDEFCRGFEDFPICSNVIFLGGKAEFLQKLTS